MSELEQDQDTLEIDFDNGAVKGRTTKKNFKKQMELLKDFTYP